MTVDVVILTMSEGILNVLLVRYDLMLDVAGGRSWSECRRVLSPKATV